MFASPEFDAVDVHRQIAFARLIMLNRVGIIKLLIRRFNYRSYLEIGCRKNACFRRIRLAQKVGVDPKEGGTHRMDSDSFFATNERMFDIIFIDGLHEAEQVRRDIRNSLAALTPNGTVVVHDLNPLTHEMQELPRRVKKWCGDCWKAWTRVRCERSDLSMFVVDVDSGVGIIRFGEQDLIKTPAELTYEAFRMHRRDWLNLISEREFYLWFSGICSKPGQNKVFPTT